MNIRNRLTTFLLLVLCGTLWPVPRASAQDPAGPAGPGGSNAASNPGSTAGLANPEDKQFTRDTMGTEASTDAIIRYDPETDTIIVITDDATNAQIAQVVQTLDRPVSQVLIKVLFLEVTHNKDLDVGAEGSYTYGPESALDTIMTDFGVASASEGGVYNILDKDLSITLRALATVGKTEVLSRPSVLARNNETATITIGQEVPFIRNTRVTESGQTINTVEYEDIGIILEVTPHITAERLVEMEVIPEISTLTDETVPISDTVDAQVIAKRNAETYCVVADGRTVVIGGLMEDQDIETVNKVPMLGDIPVLGALFRRTERSKTKTELLIFLTPYVIDSPTGLEQVTASERDKTELSPAALQSEAGQKKYFDAPQP